MTLDERIPVMSGAELEILRANAARLAKSGTPKQVLEAERVLPLIDAELSQRRANAPTPVKKPRAAPKTKTAKAAKPAKVKKASADSEDA